jgi:hypothetical protein
LPSDLANWAGKTEGRTALEKESFQSMEGQQLKAKCALSSSVKAEE